MVTPFNSDMSIDFSSMEKILNHIIEGGVSYVVVLGTTGEATTLSDEEKQAVISFTVESTEGRVPVIAGVGGNNTGSVIDSILSLDLEGVDALLSVSPCYNKPSQEGLYQHYKAIATSSPLPVILYNVPSRTAGNITAETTLRLAHDFSNIAGIKEASGDMCQVMKIIRDRPGEFKVISGDDMTALQIIAAGGDGVISVLSNVYPSEWSKMVSLALNENFSEARDIHYRHLDPIEMLFEDGNPAGIKAFLYAMSLCKNKLRLPLVPVNSDLYGRISSFVKTY